jgi:hypothetical protein
VPDSFPTPLALLFLNWRTPALTVDAVRSAQRTAPPDCALRLLVIDNGSGDDSVPVLRRELPDADVIALPENVGFARAMNAGLARVSERYAFLLNSDILFRPGAIAALLAALRAWPDAALACPRLLFPDGREQRAVVTEPAVVWELLNRSLPRHFLSVSRDRVSAVPSVVGPCMALDLERVRPLGLFDERFFFFFEETDLCRRLRRAGRQVLYVPGAEVVHLQGESANRFPWRARVQFCISRYRYFAKHATPLAAGVLYLGFVLRLTLTLVAQALLLLLTLGRRPPRARFQVTAVLWLWHLLLCRPAWGFAPSRGRPSAVRRPPSE